MNNCFYLLRIIFCFFLCPASLILAYQEKIAIIGAGYVGLVTGACLAELGYQITCVDIDEKKINDLNLGVIPIFEPGLCEMIAKNRQNRKLSFSSNIDTTIDEAQIIIITVGTPMDSTGNVDLSSLEKVAKTIESHLATYKIICIKSSVPPGTNEIIKKQIQQSCGHKNFDVISNPEFLREGSAINDFFDKNPVVLGSDSNKAFEIMETIYRPLLNKGRELIKTNFVTAELIKYGWNTFSTMKISYVNTLADICEKINADIYSLIFGMSFSDNLLPIRNIKPGPGIGGSCLLKDTNAFALFARKVGIDLDMATTALKSNIDHKQNIWNEFYNLMQNNLTQKTVAVLGLSFKANTNDIRSSPAITFITNLLAHGALVKAYDPQAIEQMKMLFPEITYCQSAYQALESADALLLLTDWDEFKVLDFTIIASIMKHAIVMDTRNIWDPVALKKAGFKFKNLGRIS